VLLLVLDQENQLVCGSAVIDGWQSMQGINWNPVWLEGQLQEVDPTCHSSCIVFAWRGNWQWMSVKKDEISNVPFG
jgi:hypothetical protein